MPNLNAQMIGETEPACTAMTYALDIADDGAERVDEDPNAPMIVDMEDLIVIGDVAQWYLRRVWLEHFRPDFEIPARQFLRNMCGF